MKKFINKRTISTMVAIVMASAMAYMMTYCFNDASTMLLSNLGHMLIEASEKAIANHNTPFGMLMAIVAVAATYVVVKGLFMIMLKDFGKKSSIDEEIEAA